MNNYELMVIFSPVLTEESCKVIQQKYRDFLKENGGDLEYEDFWGLRTLAYQINKRNTGFYWVLEYKSDGSLNEKLKVQFLRDDNVMRHLITKLDKYALAYNLKKRKPAVV